MKKQFGLLLYVVALSGILALQLHSHQSIVQERLSRHGFSSKPMEENVADKARWEYLQLRDPATGQVPLGIRQRELAFVRTLPAATPPAMKEAALMIHTTGWTSAGPTNVGGRTQAIGVDISNEANILIATAQGGVWRSTDSGDRWTRSTAPDQLKDIMSLVQDSRPGKTNIWYCGTGELLSTTDRRIQILYPYVPRTTDIGNGIYKSIDSGKSWTILPSTVDQTVTTLDSPFDGVWNIVVDNSHQEQDIVYAAGFGAIMRSTDGGTTWAHVLGDSLNRSFCTDVQITSTGVLYAYFSQEVIGSGTSSTQGIWRSTDGVHWTNITPSSLPPVFIRMKIAIAPSNENVVYLGGETPGYGTSDHGIFKYRYYSGDGTGSGGVWEDRSDGLPNSIYTLFGYALALKVMPDDTNFVLMGGTDLYRSTDGFATSDNVDDIAGYSSPDSHPDNHDVAFRPSNPHQMYNSNDGGIFMTYDVRANNGGNGPRWKDLNSGIVATMIYDVGLDHATPHDSTIVGGFQDQGSWIYLHSKEWGSYDGGDGCFCAIADKKTAFYMSSQRASIDRWILNSKLGYVSATSIQPSGIPDPQFVTPWTLDPTNTDEMYLAANNTLWKNTDLRKADANWEELDLTLSDTSYITAFGISTVPTHRVYFGTSDGLLFRMDDADSGTPAPHEITGENFPKNAFISCVAVDPQNADSIIVCFSNYHVVSLFASNDGGKTWQNISGNLEQNPDGSGDGPSTRWVSIVCQNNQRLFLVGTSVGLFSTQDISSNTTWSQEGAETIGHTIVENIDVRQSDGFVAIATQGSGVFTSTVAASEGVAKTNMTLTNDLSVYPNPASARTTVSLSLPSATNLSVSVVDVAGKTLQRVYTGNAQSGLSRYSIDGSRLPSGTYYVQATAGNIVETKRFIIEH